MHSSLPSFLLSLKDVVNLFIFSSTPPFLCLFSGNRCFVTIEFVTKNTSTIKLYCSAIFSILSGDTFLLFSLSFFLLFLYFVFNTFSGFYFSFFSFLLIVKHCQASPSLSLSLFLCFLYFFVL